MVPDPSESYLQSDAALALAFEISGARSKRQLCEAVVKGQGPIGRRAKGRGARLCFGASFIHVHFKFEAWTGFFCCIADSHQEFVEGYSLAWGTCVAGSGLFAPWFFPVLGRFPRLTLAWFGRILSDSSLQNRRHKAPDLSAKVNFLTSSVGWFGYALTGVSFKGNADAI